MISSLKPPEASRTKTPLSYIEHWIPLTCLYIFVRVLFLFTAGAGISNAAELYQGFIGYELLHGLRTWFQDYQVDAYTAGSLATGAMAAVYFKLLGFNLFALKLAPLTFSAAGFALLFKTLQSYFDRRSAFWTAILFIAAPPGAAALSLMALGSHPESFFFTAFVMAAFFKILLSDSPKKWDFFVFGFAAGLSLWYSLINGIVLAACILTGLLFLRDKKGPFILSLVIFGFLTGFSPWFFYNATHEWQGLSFVAQSLADSLTYASPMQLLQSILLEFKNALLSHVPHSFFYPSFLGFRGSAWDRLYLAGALLPFCMIIFNPVKRAPFTIFDPHNSKYFFFLSYLGLFLVCFIFSRQAFPLDNLSHPYQYRYFAPFQAVLLTTAGIFAVHLLKRPAILLPLILLGLTGQIRYAALHSSPIPAWKLPGYYTEDPERFWRNSSTSIPNSVEDFQILRQNQKNSASKYGYFMRLIHSEAFWQKNSVSDRLKILNLMDSSERRFFLMNWGRYDAQNQKINWQEQVPAPSDLAPHDRKYYLLGFSEFLDFRSVQNLEAADHFIRRQRQGDQRWFYFALGAQILDWPSFLDPPQFYFDESALFSATLMPEPQKWFYRGIGTSLTWAAESAPLLDRLTSGLPFIKSNSNGLEQLYWGLGWELQKRNLPRILPADQFLQISKDSRHLEYLRNGAHAQILS